MLSESLVVCPNLCIFIRLHTGMMNWIELLDINLSSLVQKCASTRLRFKKKSLWITICSHSKRRSCCPQPQNCNQLWHCSLLFLSIKASTSNTHQVQILRHNFTQRIKELCTEQAILNFLRQKKIWFTRISDSFSKQQSQPPCWSLCYWTACIE